MPSPSAAAISARERLARHHGAGRIGRDLPTSTPLSGVRRCASSSMSGVIAQRVAAVVSISTGFAAERLEDVAVRRIAGHRDRDAVAGLEQRQEREDECRPTSRWSRSRAPDRPRRRRSRCSAAQCARAATGCRAPRCRRAGRIKRRARGIERGRRRGRRRLADLHVDHPAAGRLDARRRRHHVHHHERRDVAARRGHDQAFRRFEHRFNRPLAGNRTAPLLPHSAASRSPGATARYQLAGLQAQWAGSTSGCARHADVVSVAATNRCSGPGWPA